MFCRVRLPRGCLSLRPSDCIVPKSVSPCGDVLPGNASGSEIVKGELGRWETCRRGLIRQRKTRPRSDGAHKGPMGPRPKFGAHPNWSQIQIWAPNLGSKFELKIGLPICAPIGAPTWGPHFGAKNFVPNWGPKLGALVWASNLGPKFGTQLWGPNLKPKLGTQPWAPT
jgi:hypothetical protein